MKRTGIHSGYQDIIGAAAREEQLPSINVTERVMARIRGLEQVRSRSGIRFLKQNGCNLRAADHSNGLRGGHVENGFIVLSVRTHSPRYQFAKVAQLIVDNGSLKKRGIRGRWSCLRIPLGM